MVEAIDIQTLSGVGLASVIARRSVGAAEVAGALGLAPAEGPRWSGGAGRTLIGVGPGAWLLLQETGGPDFIPGLRAALGKAAYVADQSGAYTLRRLSGPGAQPLLQRGVPVDLHPDAFPLGAAAVTVIAHIGAVLWRLEPPAGFGLAVFRSYAASFDHWLAQAAAAL